MKKRSFLALMVTGGTAWLLAKANSQALRDTPVASVADKVKSLADVKPQSYTGVVHKSLEIYTFTTPAMTYHIADPSQFIDEIAKEQGITSPFYDIETCVRGVLSPKGHYGHLGHLDYQLNVVGRCDDYDYSKKSATTKPLSSTPPVLEVSQTDVTDLEKSLNVGGKS